MINPLLWITFRTLGTFLGYGAKYCSQHGMRYWVTRAEIGVCTSERTREMETTEGRLHCIGLYSLRVGRSPRGVILRVKREMVALQ